METKSKFYFTHIVSFTRIFPTQAAAQHTHLVLSLSNILAKSFIK